MARAPLAAALLLGCLALTPLDGAGQQTDLRREILESQRRLEQIRAERARLREEMASMRTRVTDVTTELAGVERQLSASRSVLAEIEFQSEATSLQIQETTRELVLSRERHSESQAILNRRLRDIYKMGPLHAVRVLLGASSFTDLLNRYRYMERIASFDRALVDRVAQLERDLVEQSEELNERMAQLGSLRQNRLAEVAQLRQLEAQHRTVLTEFRSRERQTVSRLDQLDQDESRMTSLIDDLERRRREIEAARARSAEGSTLSGADAGTLDWPIEGDVIYRFGREQRPNGTVLRWHGIGIAAPLGTPVRAVRDGQVVLAGPFEGYGPTVILSHGGGFYTLYLYLEEIGVVQGRDVTAGQVVGTVGGADTPEGTHLEFQIRAPVEGGSPQAQDPLGWLRPRSGG